MTFHLTWDPISAAGFFTFNQTSQQVSVKPGLHLKSDGFPSSNFSLILSVDDGILRTLPVNIEFKIKVELTHPPVFSQSSYNKQVNEGKAGDVVIPSLMNSVTDKDNSIITFSLINSTYSHYFTINSTTGKMIYSRDYDTDPNGLPSTLTLTVQATDDSDLSATTNFILTIVNLNQQPEFLNLPNSTNIPENALTGGVVFTVSARDPDTTDTLTYKFLNPKSFVNTYLTIDSQSGVITVNRTKDLDYETLDPKTVSIGIIVGNTHHTVEEILTVHVVNVNEPPYFTSTSYNVTTTTGPAGRIIVNSLVELVQDPDLTDTVFTYSLMPDVYTHLFQIDSSNGHIVFAEDYGTNRTIYPKEVILVVRATDSGGLQGEVPYLVIINLEEQGPVITNLPDTIQLNENTATGTVIYTVTATDINPGDTVTFRMQSFDTVFSISPDGVISITNGSILNYETFEQTINLEITAFDGVLFSNVSILTVKLQDVNEPPTFTQTQYNITVDEGKTGQSVVSSLSQLASDPDINDTVVFSLANIASGVSIDQSLGRITFSMDYPSTSPNPAVFMVIATDSGGLSSSATVTVTIVNIMNTTTSVNEASTETTTRVLDETTVTMTIVNIMNTTTSVNEASTETTTRGQDDTTLSTKTTSDVSPQNRAPQFTNLPQTITLLSDTPAGTVIFTIETSDPDVNDVITVKMATDAAFNFDTNSYTVSVSNGAMLTSNATYRLLFTVTDGQYTGSSTLTVQIYLTGDRVTDKPTAESTTPNDVGATGATGATVKPNPEGAEPLFNRPWVISAIVVVAIIVPSLTILVICIICRRRNTADKDEYSDDQSMKTLPMSFYPSYHPEREPVPISFDNAVYYAK
ncbi:cadherin EGF LAG seven-pass G-type receptor 1 isoform X2 [Patella vulgata]|nr:cadherin EGF LAG seven-pass G-type receptor 1 isoform X2 [Patella vulgata]